MAVPDNEPSRNELLSVMTDGSVVETVLDYIDRRNTAVRLGARSLSEIRERTEQVAAREGKEFGVLGQEDDNGVLGPDGGIFVKGSR